MGEVFKTKPANTRTGYFWVCYACSNAGGNHTLSEECFGSCFPQVYFLLNWLYSAQRNLSPEIKSLSKSARLIGLPTADRSWWEQSQEEELIWELGSAPSLWPAARVAGMPSAALHWGSNSWGKQNPSRAVEVQLASLESVPWHAPVSPWALCHAKGCRGTGTKRKHQWPQSLGKAEAQRITRGKCTDWSFLSLMPALEPLSQAGTTWVHSRKPLSPLNTAAVWEQTGNEQGNHSAMHCQLLLPVSLC